MVHPGIALRDLHCTKTGQHANRKGLASVPSSSGTGAYSGRREALDRAIVPTEVPQYLVHMELWTGIGES